LALLTSDGKVYQIAGDLADNNAKLIPHLTHTTVVITGDTKGGTTETNGKKMMISRVRAEDGVEGDASRMSCAQASLHRSDPSR
jgi:hypothetical protein